MLVPMKPKLPKAGRSLRDAVLAKNPRAFVRYFDHFRHIGATYDETLEALGRIFDTAGKTRPTLAEIDGALYEADCGY